MDFHGVDVAATNPHAAADELISRALGATPPAAYRLVNSYTFALASRDASYMQLLRGPGINLPDGGPLSSVLQRTHETECRQVRGPGLFEDCLDRGRDYGVRHFFLGGSQAALDQLVAEVERRFPGCQIAGSWSPPFRALSSAELEWQDMMIAESGAHVVWVGLGTPKQDVEALRIVNSIGVTTAAVGAAFDFTAGTKAVAPKWMQRTHLEWLFRLSMEPRRLWKRYLFGNARFLSLAYQHSRRTKTAA
ncbi:WecB/TagA/CpsF family glycosyltransferase [Nocardioides aestuarii]|uniref:WecB/TagA/CpsF family glycosyltransferase n=1 Tax=Nocardioides aestuarii TaxID=252231 RepID=UPI0031CE1729